MVRCGIISCHAMSCYLMFVLCFGEVGDWFSVVVDRRCLEDDPEGSDEAGGREDPEEEAVKDKGHVLPVLPDLQQRQQTTAYQFNEAVCLTN